MNLSALLVSLGVFAAVASPTGERPGRRVFDYCQLLLNPFADARRVSVRSNLRDQSVFNAVVVENWAHLTADVTDPARLIWLEDAVLDPARRDVFLHESIAENPPVPRALAWYMLRRENSRMRSHRGPRGLRRAETLVGHSFAGGYLDDWEPLPFDRAKYEADPRVAALRRANPNRWAANQ